MKSEYQCQRVGIGAFCFSTSRKGSPNKLNVGSYQTNFNNQAQRPKRKNLYFNAELTPYDITFVY